MHRALCIIIRVIGCVCVYARERLVSVKLNLQFVINSKLAEKSKRLQSTSERAKNAFENVTFAPLFSSAWKFNLNRTFFSTSYVLHSLLHLLSFPILYAFDHAVASSAICHSFSFIQFNLMLQWCNFPYFLSHSLSIARSCLSLIANFGPASPYTTKSKLFILNKRLFFSSSAVHIVS